MAYVARQPSKGLAPFVQALWYVSADAANAQINERVLPGGGTVELAVNLVDDEIRLDDPGPVRISSGALVAGPRTRSYSYDPRMRSLVVGVHFKPGGAFPFLGVSPAEIVNAHVPLGD